MISEWMRVMLEEIASKKADAERARLEEQMRAKESAAVVVESATGAREKKIGDAE